MALVYIDGYGLLFACGIWCVADVSTVSSLSKQKLNMGLINKG